MHKVVFENNHTNSSDRIFHGLKRRKYTAGDMVIHIMKNRNIESAKTSTYSFSNGNQNLRCVLLRVWHLKKCQAWRWAGWRHYQTTEKEILCCFGRVCLCFGAPMGSGGVVEGWDTHPRPRGGGLR